MRNPIFFVLALFIGGYLIITLDSGCAQIGFPTGGARDSLAPVLIKASPENGKLNFTGNRITLTFDEYIEVKDIQSNLLVSPLPKTNPTITNNLKTISIKLRDTLLPNTTYSINFGNAIVDVHEGNALRDFTYTFSTGNYIDSFEIAGKLLMAESGKADSTMQVLLYKNAVDTEITSRKPDYITKPDGKGNFIFHHLPRADFRIYALKDGDGGKTYNSKTETFAFIDTVIQTGNSLRPFILLAYVEEKPPASKPAPASTKKPVVDKKLKYSSSLAGGTQDILQPLSINFTTSLESFDSSGLKLTDTSFNIISSAGVTLDSTRKRVLIETNWQPETGYFLLVGKDAFVDSAGNKLEKSDTIRFITKREADYGRLVISFKNLDLAKNPVIQFLQNDAIRFSARITTTEWSNKRIVPGEYEVRILYDQNNNGTWDPGNFNEKRQPERAISLPQKIAIKADWDNEREIQL